MRKLIALMMLMMVIVIGLIAVSGCSTFGNGKIDVPVEISIEWHDNFGNGFTLVDGTLTEATYRSVKTDAVYEFTDSDGFLISHPNTGAMVRIKLKESVEVPNDE